MFLSLIGQSTYKTLRNLLSPDKPGDRSVDTLSKHYKPAPSEIVERFRFNSRIRRPGESIAAFVAELRALAEFYNFGDKLEVMLRDRIVCGINDDSIQRRLLSESRLDYAKAVETALNMETTAQSMKTLKSKAEGLSTEGDSAAQSQVKKTSTTASKSGKSVLSLWDPWTRRAQVSGGQKHYLSLLQEERAHAAGLQEQEQEQRRGVCCW